MSLKTYTTCLIFILYASILCSQNLQLKVIGFDDNETSIISQYNSKTTFDSYEELKLNVSKIENTLRQNGYINIQLLSIINSKNNLYIAQIALKNKIENVVLYINPTFQSKSYFSKLNIDNLKNNTFKVPYLALEKLLIKYNKIISETGQPFSTVQLSDVKQKNNTTFSANLIITTKEKNRQLDKIIIKGYDKFPKSYLKRFLKIQKNITFNLSSINKKTLQLNNLSFASQTKPAEILFTKDSTHLYIYLKKTPSNNFDGFIGFTTNEQTNKLEFNGYLNLQLVNNLNYGESLYLDYKSDESEKKNFNLIANLPYIFKTPIGLEASLNITKRDSSFINLKQKVSLFYQLNDRTSLYAGIETTESSDLSDNLENIEDYSSNFLKLKYQFRQLQNEDPLFKIKTEINTEFGAGKRQATLNNQNQNSIDFNGSHIFNLNNNNSFYIKNIIQLILSENYLENELIRFGGVNTLRGFTENSLIANSIYILNTEYRYKLSDNIFVNSVIDIAHFKNDNLNQKENLYGFGFGFGILTNAGILRFIYANGKTEQTPFNFSNSKIHISLKATF
ncbi:ShlB/FhaC/HecB family hemolysin secretion/activation protein [Olleya namhaensis]|uniref:ShlB/FhaC/HecB family hemolysin secretion/activation protein n=1 Tax=Olleya namhaensis TaxID=1144750 RepID=UPI00232FD678|nr:hypothetical protein [Olleya namhaensis]